MVSMVNVQISSNAGRQPAKLYPSDTVVRGILEENEMLTGNAIINLDGAPLGASDYGKTLADFGVTDRCAITAVVKMTNGN